jgi:predicted dienelactone hydrolase
VVGEPNLTVLNPLPAKVSDESIIPLLVSIPKAPKPAPGWPMVFFQHGITRNRTHMLAVADGLANAGFAVVAMDPPLDGLTTNAAVNREMQAEMAVCLTTDGASVKV